METYQYTLTRFWRYIFTPLLLLTLVFGWYVIFTLPGSQLTPTLSALPSAPVASVAAAASLGSPK